MKNLATFTVRHAIAFIILLPILVLAQQMPDTVSGEIQHMHAEKVRSTSLTLILGPETPVKLPAAGGSLTMGDKTITLTPADFAALPHNSFTVLNGHTNASETYSGVAVTTLLKRLGLPFEKSHEHALLKTYLLAEGTDGYQVLLSAYEAIPFVHQGSVIVADTLNGQPLDKDGAFKLVISADNRPQRWVQNLKSLTFKTID